MEKNTENTQNTEAEVKENAPAPENKKVKKDKKAQIQELNDKIAELESKILYMQADYQNFRRRTAKDISDARISGTANALEPFLNVNDFLGMAQMAIEKSDNVEAIKQGIMMIIQQYNRAMEELNVTVLETAGAKFDPELHDAVSQEYSDTIPEGCIIREMRKGYKMGERLLRPANVIVSKGREADHTSENFPADDAETEKQTEKENEQE
ncbi:MAG: nucleotide exchange factor GrpE [Lentisphaeria bacterium]|nr:nucleotide exchange factor GrpE [Lentisphaeria bacterium]